MSWLCRLSVGSEIIQTEKIWDNYAWHQRIWLDCFPHEPDAKRDFLTRIDSLEHCCRVWILAKRAPGRPKWCPQDSFELKEISPSFLSHRYYAFDLKANPVRTKVQRGPDGETLYKANGKRKSGKRVPLIKKDELREWLLSKGKNRRDDKGLQLDGGFHILEDRSLEISPMQANYFRKHEHRAYHGGVQFRGSLEITDREAFIQTYQYGIGSAKSFGFGLMLLAPIKL